MCLISIIIIPRKKILLPLLLITELFSCALDQNRWQPCEYQYLFTLFAFIVYRALEQCHAVDRERDAYVTFYFRIH
jgi:hypothetical protein